MRPRRPPAISAWPDLELRARLVQADLLRRRGNVAEAGRQVQEIHRWATEHDARHLLARTHFVLTAVFQELGDLSTALEHAVRAVDLLGEEPSPALHLDHLARLADCLGLSGDVAARERYDDALRLAAELGDVDRQLLVLNNRAYCETLVGAFDEALVWSTQLQDAGRRARHPPRRRPAGHDRPGADGPGPARRRRGRDAAGPAARRCSRRPGTATPAPTSC